MQVLSPKSLHTCQACLILQSVMIQQVRWPAATVNSDAYTTCRVRSETTLFCQNSCTTQISTQCTQCTTWRCSDESIWIETQHDIPTPGHVSKSSDFKGQTIHRDAGFWFLGKTELLSVPNIYEELQKTSSLPVPCKSKYKFWHISEIAAKTHMTTVIPA